MGLPTSVPQQIPRGSTLSSSASHCSEKLSHLCWESAGKWVLVWANKMSIPSYIIKETPREPSLSSSPFCCSQGTIPFLQGPPGRHVPSKPTRLSSITFIPPQILRGPNLSSGPSHCSWGTILSVQELAGWHAPLYTEIDLLILCLTENPKGAQFQLKTLLVQSGSYTSTPPCFTADLEGGQSQLWPFLQQSRN